MPRLLLVSNRLPVTIKNGEGGLVATPSSGGLATGLRGPHERSGGLWIGWPGDLSSLDDGRRAELAALLREKRAVPVVLAPEELHGFYDSFSNGILWPLFHYLVDKVHLDSWDFETYQRVNEKFADHVAAEYQAGDLIWVHDYHLALVPAMLRTRLPDARIAFFLHIPFPSFEVFRILPWRRDILEGMLGADLIGFHTLAYVRHFMSSLLRVLGIEADVDRVRYGGREVRIGAFPMGVDAAGFAELAESPEVVARAAEIRNEAGGRRIILGVDRLDYTKGVRRRLLTIERLLAREPEFGSRIRVIQLAVPSRSGIEAYDDFRRSVDEIVGRINGLYATPDSVVIHYMFRSLSRRELVAMYRAADVMLVTPLRDGMNLVSKEFAAARTDEDGVLVLSEFAGAADELGGALIVNPYDIDQAASTVLRALAMPATERRARMRALRRRVLRHDVHEWAETFVGEIERSHPGAPGQTVRASRRDEIELLVQEIASAPALVAFLDYDGTLVPFAGTPEEAAPDAELLDLLRSLAGCRETRVHILSGRRRGDLEKWFGDLPIGLHAEHGFWSRVGADAGWEALREGATEWKMKVVPILEHFVARTPRSFIEEKTASITWHYRLSDLEPARVQAIELRHYLREALANMPVEVLTAAKAVEVRLYGIHKGLVAQRILAEAAAGEELSRNGTIAVLESTAVLAIGDDRTDEDLFAAIPPRGYTVHVGPNASRARYRLADVACARAFLRAIAEGRGKRAAQRETRPVTG